MSKMTISKIKKLCNVTIIPRILRDEVTLYPRILGKRPLDGFRKMAKSTDSKDKDAECEKCKKLIEIVFGRDDLVKRVESNIEDIHMKKIQKVVASNMTVNKSNESNSPLGVENRQKEIESVKRVGSESIGETVSRNLTDNTPFPMANILKSTTAKSTEEHLAQKLETIEEPGLVEAATPKIDGFNTSPKVLGAQENMLDNNNSLCTKIGSEENSLDEIAKKCLGTPPDKIDERILEEMKSFGMLRTGQKKASPRSYYHEIERKEKEAFLNTRSEQRTLNYKCQQKTSSPLNNYRLMRHHNTKLAHNPQNVYPAYFKNVSLHLIGNGQSNNKNNIHKNSSIDHKENKSKLKDVTTKLEENSLLDSCDNSAVVDSDKQIPIIRNQTSPKTEHVLTTTSAIEKEKPKEIIDSLEVEVEKIRLTTAETSRIEIPGETEIDPDFDHKNTKPDVLPCNEILQIGETPIEETCVEPDKNEDIVFSNAARPTDGHFRPDLPSYSSQNPNTAISGTYPQIEQKQESDPSKFDTSISSKQNPGEYFDLSHCNIEKVQEDYDITLSEIRHLAPYHQYTIVTGTDETEKSEHSLLSMNIAPEISLPHLPENDSQIKEQDSPTSINKSMSATTEPLPRLNDMEKELSLTELLKRVRERNRIQYCRECSLNAVEAEPVEANKCPPPLDKGPEKTLGPGPCKPKPKPACPPPPPPPPAPPCKPKDPCAKFTRTGIIENKIKEAMNFVLGMASNPAIPLQSLSYKSKTNTAVEPTRQMFNDENISRTENLGYLLSSCQENKKQYEDKDVVLARDYEPWSPIPSWPIPKKEKKVPFVCPKEGCKLIPPPRLNSPCKENPCTSLPKRTFSLTDFEYEPLYLYDN